MKSTAKLRRRTAMAMWRIVNPLVLRLAGHLSWWVVLETTGRHTGSSRRVPLARGPVADRTVWLIAVHGRHAAFAKNIARSPSVRLKLDGRWHEGEATLMPLDPAIVSGFNRYARSGPRTMGIDPALLRIELSGPS